MVVVVSLFIINDGIGLLAPLEGLLYTTNFLLLPLALPLTCSKNHKRFIGIYSHFYLFESYYKHNIQRRVFSFSNLRISSFKSGFEPEIKEFWEGSPNNQDRRSLVV